MQDLEKAVLKKLTFRPVFYFRYVDDVVLTASLDELEDLLNNFNNYDERLKFTVEIQKGFSLRVLDVKLIVSNNEIICDWFHKSSFSGRYLNFYSAHPISQKIGTIIGMTDRALLLSHPKFHEKNLHLVINTLVSNNYLLHLIFNILNNRIKFLVNNRLNPIKNNLSMNSDFHSKNFFVIPFINGLSFAISKYLKNQKREGYLLAFCSLNKLKKFIKVLKDPLDHTHQKNVIYKLQCDFCDVTYVG